MLDSEIKVLNDLKGFRSAPDIDAGQSINLLKELCSFVQVSDWFTIGIMSPSANQAILTLKEIEKYFHWTEMKVIERPKEDGPVFLKANQKTGDVYVRVEYGLGEGILISCQHNDEKENADTFGPFPLDFFKLKK